jgi:hypothetical protein
MNLNTRAFAWVGKANKTKTPRRRRRRRRRERKKERKKRKCCVLSSL